MIVSRHNQKLKSIRRLKRCKGDLAVLEGPHLIREALNAGLEFESVLATPDFVAGVEGQGISRDLVVGPTIIDPRLLADISDTDSPQGLLAVARVPRGGVPSVPAERGGLVLLVDGMQDPGNLGALARTAEAFEATALALTPGSVHPNHPRALRASAGSLLRLPAAVNVDPDDLALHLEAISPRWIALTPHGGRLLSESDLGGSLVLAVGSEGSGLSSAIQERVSEEVTIPTPGTVESLNVTVAAAVVLFERRRRSEPQ